jgi:prepilin-type N-terminal cleavage/methylation domain-containing protein
MSKVELVLPIPDGLICIKHHQGFSLVEMAIVLIIFGHFLSATLIPLSAQRDLSDYRTARSDLDQIKEALLGYLISKGSLRCSDTIGKGAADNSCSAGAIVQGDIPWTGLGVSRLESWGQPYRYCVDKNFVSPSVILLSSSGSIYLYSSSNLIQKIASNLPTVVHGSGKNGGIQSPPSTLADELKNTAIGPNELDNTFVTNEITSDFDDLVVWVPSSILFSRMVSAQKLPV